MKPHLITVAFLLGLAAITAGVALSLGTGAGLIVGGALAAGVAWQLDRTEHDVVRKDQ